MKSFSWLIPAALCLTGCSQTSTPGTATVPANTAPATSNAANSQPVRGYLRALHAVPGSGPLSFTADSQKFGATDYGNVSAFEGVSAERVEVSAYGGDGKKVAGPMPLSLGQGEDVTVLVTGIPGDVVLLPWKHKNGGAESGKAKIAFVHSAKALPAMDLTLDGKSLRRNVKFGIATDYFTLAPGKHQFQAQYDKSLEPQIVVTEQPAIVTKDTAGNVLGVEQPTPIQSEIPRAQLVTLTQEMTLEAGKVYSLAVFTGADKIPKVRIMEDKFVPELAKAKTAS